MTTFSALVEVTLRGVLDRRRTILLLLFVALPVIVALAIRLAGGRPDVPEILDTLVIRTVLPLVALVIGTSALGSEIDDGTFVYLLVKPIARWRVALAKLAVATGLTIALDYPETEALIPGDLGAQSVLDRVTDLPDGLPTIEDRDFEVQVGVVSFAPIAPGVFYRVALDSCGAPTADQFGCQVRSASDAEGADITSQVNCSVTIP